MSLLAYNVRTIVFHCVFIGLFIPLIILDIKETKSKAQKITMRVIGILCSIGLVGSFVGSVSISNQVTDRGKVVDITVNGSLGGASDTYDVKIKRSDGTTESYLTHLYAPRYLKEDIEKLKNGDEVELYANNLLNFLYRVDKVDKS